MKNVFVLLSVIAAALIASQSVPLFAQEEKSELPLAGIHWAKGEPHDRAAKASGGSPNMTWHGGNIMSNVQVTAIYWGSSWGNGNFTGDKITGLATFYSGMGFSTYAH